MAALVAVAFGVGGYAIGRRSSTVEVSAGTRSTAESAPRAGDPAGTEVSTGPETDGEMPVTKAIIERRTKSGIDLRVDRTPTRPLPPDPALPPNLPPPPAECVTTASLDIGLFLHRQFMNTEIRVSAATDPRAVVGVATLGSDNVVLVVVVTGAGRSTVRAAFPGGGADSMKATGGTAVLVEEVPEDLLARWQEVTVTLRSGSEATPLPLSEDTYLSLGGFGPSLTRSDASVLPMPDCTAQLPPPGEQPADAAAAREAVLTSFRTVYDFTAPAAERDRFIDDPSKVGEMITALLGAATGGSSTDTGFEPSGVVFTDPTTAVVRFSATIPPGLGSEGYKGILFGTAHLVDGIWKLERAGVCGSLTFNGFSCDNLPT